MDRRTALLFMGLGAGGAAGGAAPALARPSRKPVESRFLTLDPEQAFRAHFRYERDLRPEGQALTWYHFTVYAAVVGERPKPVVRFEGMEFSYFREIAPLTWKIDAHNVSYPRDLTTGAFVEAVRNPVTGRTVAPQKMVLLDDPGVVYGPKGYLLANAERDGWLPSTLTFRVSDDDVVVDHIRPKPESWPKTFMESSTSWVSRRDFDDPRVTSLMCGVSGFYTFPFPAWLEMGDRQGLMIGAWFGEKIPSVDYLPEEFAARVRREHPDLLRPRLALLDRPLSPLTQRLVAELRTP
jgi:hypothetical protein